MYLACETRTILDQRHPLKIVVPAKTTVIEELRSTQNDLNCLNFDKCDPLHAFDPESNTVHMKITEEEHDKQFKE